MAPNDSKPYLSHLNKLVDQYNSAHYALTEKIKTNDKAPMLKVNDRRGITKYKNIFNKGHTENWSREIFIIDSFLKTNPWSYKIKDLNGEKIMGRFYEKEFFWSML